MSRNTVTFERFILCADALFFFILEPDVNKLSEPQYLLRIVVIYIFVTNNFSDLNNLGRL